MATKSLALARETSSTGRNDRVIVHQAPEATTTAVPRWAAVRADSLFGRDKSVGSGTCGFISGETGYYPLTCGKTYTCTNSGRFRGCCDSNYCSSSIAYYTTCLDGTASACSSASVGLNTACCTYNSSYPYCVTYLWSTTASPGHVFTEYNCDASIYSGAYILAATTGASSSASSTSSTSSSSYASSTALSSPTSSAPTQTQTSPSSDSTNISSVATSSQSTDSSKVPSLGDGSMDHSAIIGGVVGGVATIALISFLVWFLIRRKRKHTADSPVPPEQQQKSVQTPQDFQGGGGSGGSATEYVSPSPRAVARHEPQYTYAGSTGIVSPDAQRFATAHNSPAPYMHTGHESWQGQNRGQGPAAEYMYPHLQRPGGMGMMYGPSSQDQTGYTAAHQYHVKSEEVMNQPAPPSQKVELA